MQDGHRAAPGSRNHGNVADAHSKPIHGIPDTRRRPLLLQERGNWYRILGMIHKLGSDEDDGPISKVHY
ncbi:MAG: hypothetical protein JWM58_2189 [Rhizobium sp.]|nr:hypothetical protein [Rhizobium sp.]